MGAIGARRRPGDPLVRLVDGVLGALAQLGQFATFAWRTAVGPAMARATRVQLAASGTLLVQAADAYWRREVESAFPMILPRVRTLLGEATVRRLVLSD